MIQKLFKKKFKFIKTNNKKYNTKGLKKFENELIQKIKENKIEEIKALDRVIVNENQDENMASCLQINNNTIEFIYESSSSIEFQNYSKLYFLNKEKLKSKEELNFLSKFSKHLIPVDIKNNSYCGGGILLIINNIFRCCNIF
jgi:hypothetical protein